MYRVCITHSVDQHIRTNKPFSLTGIAAETPSAAVGGLPGELVHAGVGMLVLLIIQVLNMYKPRGMTPYGWRKQQERRTLSPTET